jgi:hypothetical protein
VFHISLHFILPALVAMVWWRRDWKLAYIIMMATMLVDLDHLLANPIYSPSRCSIGFHPLHQLGFILFYMALWIAPKTRLLGLGLCIHMALDALDCQVTSGVWIYSDS